MSKNSKSRKTGKIIVKLLIFFAIFYLVEYLINFALSMPLTGTRQALRGIYSNAENDYNIDLLIAGASHCSLGYDPELLSEELGCSVYNAGTSQQSLSLTDTMIREVERYNDLKTVIVDLDYTMVLQDEVNLESIYMVTQYMRPSLNKIRCFLTTTSSKYYINSFLPIGKGRVYSKSPEAILSNLRTKLSASYWAYSTEYEDGEFYSNERGTEGVFTAEGSDGLSEYDGRSIPDENREQILTIVQYCEDHDINLVFVSAPESAYYLSHVTDYDAYDAQIVDLLKDTGVPYYDFNLVRPEVLDTTDPENFYDDNHLSGTGAEQFCSALGSLLNGELTTSDLFYDSYQEKEEDMPAVVYGLDLTYGTDEIAFALEESPAMQAKEDAITYQAELLDADGNQIEELAVEATEEGGVIDLSSVSGEDRQSSTLRLIASAFTAEFDTVGTESAVVVNNNGEGEQ